MDKEALNNLIENRKMKICVNKTDKNLGPISVQIKMKLSQNAIDS